MYLKLYSEIRLIKFTVAKRLEVLFHGGKLKVAPSLDDSLCYRYPFKIILNLF